MVPWYPVKPKQILWIVKQDEWMDGLVIRAKTGYGSRMLRFSIQSSQLHKHIDLIIFESCKWRKFKPMIWGVLCTSWAACSNLILVMVGEGMWTWSPIYVLLIEMLRPVAHYMVGRADLRIHVRLWPIQFVRSSSALSIGPQAKWGSIESTEPISRNDLCSVRFYRRSGTIQFWIFLLK